MPYIVFNKQTGRILQTSPDTMRYAHLYESETTATLSVDTDKFDTECFYVEEGALVATLPRPSRYHHFDYTTKQWALPSDGIDQAQQDAIRKINAKAGDIITARLPIWKQNNMTARAVELQANQATWTTEDADEFAALQAEWDWVKSIRMASNVAVAAAQAAEDVNTLQTLIDTFNPA